MTEHQIDMEYLRIKFYMEKNFPNLLEMAVRIGRSTLICFSGN